MDHSHYATGHLYAAMRTTRLMSWRSPLVRAKASVGGGQVGHKAGQHLIHLHGDAGEVIVRGRVLRRSACRKKKKGKPITTAASATNTSYTRGNRPRSWRSTIQGWFP